MVTAKRKIAFADCDPAGVIFFSRVYEYAHAVYESFLETLRNNYFAHHSLIIPIIHSSAEYKLPVKQGEELTIIMSVADIRASSFSLSFVFYNQTGAIACTVTTVHVFANRLTGQKEPVPEDFLNLLQSNFA